MNWAVYPSFTPIMVAANWSKEKDGKVVGISLCNQIKLEVTLGSPSSPYTSHLTLFLYTPQLTLILTAAKLSKEKKRKVVGISLWQYKNFLETKTSPPNNFH